MVLVSAAAETVSPERVLPSRAARASLTATKRPEPLKSADVSAAPVSMAYALVRKSTYLAHCVPAAASLAKARTPSVASLLTMSDLAADL